MKEDVYSKIIELINVLEKEQSKYGNSLKIFQLK